MAYRAQMAAESNIVASEPAPLHFMSNHELSGIAGWFDLGDDETCSAAYKNECEMDAEGFSLTKTKILDLFNSQVSQIEGSLQQTLGTCQVAHKQTVDSLKERYPTIYERFRFQDNAEDVNLFLRAILATHKRKQWDRSIESIQQVEPVIDKNMWVIEELSNELVSGYTERKAKLKTFVFRHEDKFFVYQSSVPDSMYKTVESADEDDYDDSNDPSRYTVVFNISCFKREGSDLVLERVRQIDFRQGGSNLAINAYLNTLQTHALYWKQDLTEMITAEILARQ